MLEAALARLLRGGGDPEVYASLLKRCGVSRSLADARRVHEHLVANSQGQLLANPDLGNVLVQTYGKCGSVAEAKRAFDSICSPGASAYDSMVRAYSIHGHHAEAFALYATMQRLRLSPCARTVASLLKFCKTLEEGMELHASTRVFSVDIDELVSSAIITMYARFRQLNLARQVFDQVPNKDHVAWNAMILAYARFGHLEEALELYHEMDVDPDRMTLSCILGVCSTLKRVDQGRQVHVRAESLGYNEDAVVQTSLLNFYAKCGEVDNAKSIFDRIPLKDVVTWNSMMAAFVVNGYNHEALSLYDKMANEGVKPSSSTFTSLLHACANLQDLEKGMVIHGQVRSNPEMSSVVVETALLSLYGKCNRLDFSLELLHKNRDNLVACNAMMSAYASQGFREETLRLFWDMIRRGVQLSAASFIIALSVCWGQDHLQYGQEIHGRIIKSNLRQNVNVQNALVSMYGRCGCLEAAKSVFDCMEQRDCISWNAMIMAFIQHGEAIEALNTFNEEAKRNDIAYAKQNHAVVLLKRMQLNGFRPDGITMSTVLGVCFNLKEGRALHEIVIEGGYHDDMVVQGSLMTMYARCGKLDVAREIFDKTKDKNAIFWTGMISAYAQANMPREALKLFYKMDVPPDDVTYAVVLGACSSLGVFQEGNAIHKEMFAKNVELGVSGACGLVNMYAQCGKLEMARELFDKLQARTHITWTTIIGAYAHHSRGREALALFREMVAEGMPMDAITFTTVFIACSQEGKLNLIREFFLYMVDDFGIAPLVDHYNCVIDLLGKAGWTREAEELIRSMPFEPRVIEWASLLGACRLHRDINVGGRAAECAYELDPEDTALYLLLSNICVAVGMEVQDVETLRKKLVNKEFTASAASS